MMAIERGIEKAFEVGAHSVAVWPRPGGCSESVMLWMKRAMGKPVQAKSP